MAELDKIFGAHKPFKNRKVRQYTMGTIAQTQNSEGRHGAPPYRVCGSKSVNDALGINIRAVLDFHCVGCG